MFLPAITENSDAKVKESPPQEEKSAPVFEPPSKTESSPTGKSRKKDRRKRKRSSKASLKDEHAVMRPAGYESYDSSELSEIEFVKSREEEKSKDTQKDQDTSTTDKATFPVRTTAG